MGESAVRNTHDVYILVRRGDFEATKLALEAAGFVHRHSASLDLFLDSADSSPRHGVHIVFANEKVRPHEPAANPDVTESREMGTFRVLDLEALVRMSLTTYGCDDRVDVLDLIDVGLVDASWTTRFPPELARRLQRLLNTPEG